MPNSEYSIHIFIKQSSHSPLHSILHRALKSSRAVENRMKIGICCARGTVKSKATVPAIAATATTGAFITEKCFLCRFVAGTHKYLTYFANAQIVA